MTAPEAADRPAGSDVSAAAPNLLIAGTNKSGTTSLFYHLSAHPDVFGSNPKELKFFTNQSVERGVPDFETYLRHFEDGRDTRYRVEATPSYFAGGAGTAEAIRERLGPISIIVVFREPVDRLRSFYRAQRSAGNIPQTMGFGDYVEVCMAGPQPDPRWFGAHHVAAGAYDAFYADWHRSFGGRVLPVFFERLIADPHAETERICTWLGIDVTPLATRRFANENPSVAHRSDTLHRLARRFTSVGRQGKAPIPPNLKRRLRKIYTAINASPARSADLGPSSAETGPAVDALVDYYAAMNRSFAGTLARLHPKAELPDWLST